MTRTCFVNRPLGSYASFSLSDKSRGRQGGTRLRRFVNPGSRTQYTEQGKKLLGHPAGRASKKYDWLCYYSVVFKALKDEGRREGEYQSSHRHQDSLPPTTITPLLRARSSSKACQPDLLHYCRRPSFPSVGLSLSSDTAALHLIW